MNDLPLIVDVPDGLADTPAWFPLILERPSDLLLLVRKDEAEYRADSFLDQRALRPDANRVIVRWADVEAAFAPTARRDANYIFHIGHVGSTLISRLLGEVPGVFALREPLLLRSLTEMPEEELARRLDIVRALLSRTFRSEQRAIVKATSFTSELAQKLVPIGSRALFLFATPSHYIQSILAGPNSRQEARVLAPSRLQRLRRRCRAVDLDLSAATDAQLAALGWACEMSCLEDNAEALPIDSVMWLDFDRFLSQPNSHMTQVASFFGQDLAVADAERVAAGPLMSRYSKALEYEYSPALRRDLLAEAQEEHGSMIAEALRWLDRAGELHRGLESALHRAGDFMIREA